jgi:hypothetical protein
MWHLAHHLLLHLAHVGPVLAWPTAVPWSIGPVHAGHPHLPPTKHCRLLLLLLHLPVLCKL